jgi:hypothetical protein
LALQEEQQCKLTSDFKCLQDRALIESGQEEKRSGLRGLIKQTEELCCKLPFACTETMGFLEPYKKQFFSEERPGTLAINGFACSGDAKSTTKEVLSNVVRPKNKDPFTPSNGQYRKFTDAAAVKLGSLVKKHANHIAKGETFVDSCDDGVVLACYQEALL